LNLSSRPERSGVEGSAVLSPAKQLRTLKALKAAELLDGEAHRRSLGFARDDKLKGGGPPWQWWRRRDRTSTTATNPVSVCPRSLQPIQQVASFRRPFAR
jgi:hypothetical protein